VVSLSVPESCAPALPDVSVLRQLPGAAVVVFDAELRVVLAGGELFEARGWDPDALVGRLVEDALPPGCHAIAGPHYRAALAGEDRAFDLPAPDGDGILGVEVRPLRDAGGAVVAGVAVSRDLTSQRRAEHELRLIADNASDMISRHAPDGRYLAASQACRHLFGYEPSDLVGRDAFALWHPDDRPDPERVAEHLRHAPRSTTMSFRARRKDGVFVWAESTVRKVFAADGSVAEWHVVTRDVTERMAAERDLREAKERFASAFDGAPIGMALVAPDGRWLKANHALSEMLGRSEADLRETSFQALTHPEDLAGDLELVQQVLEGELRTYQVEKRYRHADGGWVWALLSVSLVRDDGGEPSYFVAQIEDITERRRLQARLTYLAEHDGLTGLWNRRRLEQEVEQQAGRCRRYGEHAALLVIDLDHFKFVNDTMGHKAGDDLLIGVGEALRGRLRRTDRVARLGGDEFAVLLPRTSLRDARRVAGELVEVIGRARGIGRPDAHTTASIGVAAMDRTHCSAEEAFIRADLAMYRAKEDGGGCVSVHDESSDRRERISGALLWSQRIRDALERDRFVLHAQPIVDLQTGETVQHELLIRMLGEDGEVLPPGDFLHYAERFGLMAQIDRWVVARAVELVAERDLSVEVNLSGKSLGDVGIVELVEELIAEHGVDAGRLVFEITETEAIANLDYARELAQRLQRLGCRFALDDFGSGFAGFRYLKALPFDYLKIDGDFIRDLPRNRTDQLVVRALVDVARGLGKKTVAEYVSDEEVRKLVTAGGIDLGQGFHLGRPVSVEQI
jgi:diguanylate cyclase (GGDEF)-like protein/PAS domain S-box-containing protein